MADAPRPTNKTDLSTCLPFERPVFELEQRDRLLVDIVSRLGPWERVQIARHPRRPQFRDYALGENGRPGMLDEFIELRGDRLYGDDRAISTGFAKMGRHRFLLIGHRKGRETREKLACNFWPATSAARTPRATARPSRRCAWRSASASRS
jgi:acetyl-CoA carboxylase alpha subunit